MEVVKFSSSSVPSASSASDANDSVVTLFLHGFPAIRSKQNRAIAEVVARLTNQPADVLLYAGLGQAPGVFSFSRTVSDVDAYVRSLLGGKPSVRLNLVGHSFGGFLALRLAGLFPKQIRKMVLMSPLVKVRTGDPVRAWLASYASNPELCLGNLDELYEGYSRLATEISTEKLAALVDGSVETLILQADKDNLTPPSDSKEIAKFFVREPIYELVDNDHSFLSNRAELAARIASFLVQAEPADQK